MNSPFVSGVPLSPFGFVDQPSLSPFVDAPPFYTANFAITVIFAALSFIQLVATLLLTGIKMVRKPSGDASGTVTEQELGLLRRHRARYALLMALSLIFLILVYATQATLAFYSFSLYAMYPNIYLANNSFWDIQNVFLSAVLIALLDSGIKISQLRRDAGSTENAVQVGTNVNIVVMICFVVFLVFLTVARIVVLILWNAEATSIDVLSGAIAWVEWWVQFDLDQVRIGTDLVIAIYYTVVAIVMWRKVSLVPSGADEADRDNSFRVLKRISIILCPVLLLSIVAMIIFEVLINVIVTFDNYWSFLFADDFTTGLITFLLNTAIISVYNVEQDMVNPAPMYTCDQSEKLDEDGEGPEFIDKSYQ